MIDKEKYNIARRNERLQCLYLFALLIISAFNGVKNYSRKNKYDPKLDEYLSLIGYLALPGLYLLRHLLSRKISVKQKGFELLRFAAPLSWLIFGTEGIRRIDPTITVYPIYKRSTFLLYI